MLLEKHPKSITSSINSGSLVITRSSNEFPLVANLTCCIRYTNPLLLLLLQLWVFSSTRTRPQNLECMYLLLCHVFWANKLNWIELMIRGLSTGQLNCCLPRVVEKRELNNWWHVQNRVEVILVLVLVNEPTYFAKTCTTFRPLPHLAGSILLSWTF